MNKTQRCTKLACVRQFEYCGTECDGSDDEQHHCARCGVLMAALCPLCEQAWPCKECATCLDRPDLVYRWVLHPLAFCPSKCWTKDTNSDDEFIDDFEIVGALSL